MGRGPVGRSGQDLLEKQKGRRSLVGFRGLEALVWVLDRCTSSHETQKIDDADAVRGGLRAGRESSASGGSASEGSAVRGVRREHQVHHVVHLLRWSGLLSDASEC